MNYVNVGLEDERGAYEMTCHLLEKGHRRIAFLADNMEGVDYTRYVGHQKAMAEYGLKADEKDLLIIRSYDSPAGYYQEGLPCSGYAAWDDTGGRVA